MNTKLRIRLPVTLLIFTFLGQVQAQPERCNAGVVCAGTGTGRTCTMSLSPYDMMPGRHFVGQQVAMGHGINNNAVCIQGNVTNTFTGSGTQVQQGLNTSVFPVLLQARRNPTANAPNPVCRFVWKTRYYATTSTCTIDMGDGLPVELMQFEVVFIETMKPDQDLQSDR